MNTTWAVVTKKAETNLGLYRIWPLRYQYSALPTELTSQLGAGHFVAIYLFSDRSHFDVKVLLQQEQGYVLTQGKIESICSTYTLKTCR